MKKNLGVGGSSENEKKKKLSIWGRDSHIQYNTPTPTYYIQSSYTSFRKPEFNNKENSPSLPPPPPPYRVASVPKNGPGLWSAGKCVIRGGCWSGENGARYLGY